jgi:hypothetical protein
MATKEEIAIALKVIEEVSGAPEVGLIADLVKEIKKSGDATKEVRVVSSKETR